MRRRVVVPGQASLFAEPKPVRPSPRRVIPHHCHVPGCDVSVPPRLLMCRKHWAMVPSATRRDVWRYFDPSQCAPGPRPRPTESWTRAARAAIEAVLDALGERVLKTLPRTLPVLEETPPAGMTTATLRIVIGRLRREDRARFEENRLVPADFV